MAKQLDIKAYKQWKAYIEALRRATAIDPSETFGEKKARIARLEANAEEWFAYYFPNFCTAPPAQFHRAATKRVLQNPEWFECRCWSRELAKSTRTMMETLFLTLTGKKRNVLLVSNSEDNAKRLLLPYKLQLEANLRITSDYGTQRGLGKWTDEEFLTKSGVAFRALGAGQSPRGTRNEDARPDIILIDDIDTDKDCLNPEIIKNRVDWIFDALIPTRSISVPLLIVACGNIIAEYCCMTEMAKKADKVDVVNIRNGEGKSSWAEKNSEEHIDRVLSLIPYASAQKEYFNNPLTTGRIFQSLTYGKVPPLATMEQIVVYGDPSTSNRESKNSSFKVVAMLGRKKGITYIIKVFCRQCTQADFIDAYYTMHTIATAAGATPKHYMECNSLQEGYFDTYYEPQFRNLSRERGIPLFVEKDARTKGNKFARIEATLEPAHRLGWLVFNQAEAGNADMEATEGQFKAASATYTGAVDAPDCIEGGYKMLDKHGGRAISTYRYQKRASRRY